MSALLPDISRYKCTRTKRIALQDNQHMSKIRARCEDCRNPNHEKKEKRIRCAEETLHLISAIDKITSGFRGAMIDLGETFKFTATTCSLSNKTSGVKS